MIKVRALRAALALVLVAAAAPGSALLLESRYVSCTHLLGGGLSVTCDDPATEARRREHLLGIGEVSGPGCDGMVAAGPAPSDVPVTAWVGMDPPPAPPPRATDPAVTARVNAAWDGIERWLGAHASATLRGLARPADPGAVATWEGYVRAKIPDALYASLMRHDGADGFQLPLGLVLATVSNYSSMHSNNCFLLIMGGRPGDADPGSGLWHGSLMPFASSGGGEELFIEPRTGRVGQKRGGEPVRYDGPMGWPSYLDLLEGVANALESGRPLREWYPTVTAGCELRWSDEPAPAPPAGCGG
ncbi:hypothetical protein FXF51_41440 [Nonomuraea sp. PA05]|uniref:hypothetical protein n=1 Tax=Nonomuraea sp. PA05 TaxID=2604466 RepID=UPI0011D8D2C9|nr:hypothetical protein [Nonomuraea sp. PA05]TYB56951.1 hypothetical protein FXF51_41440 [Nonomuraea sp. PA05]